MELKRHFVIDFDSTFTKVEALDILGEISLENDNEKERKLKEIEDLTEFGNEGGDLLQGIS
jgi:D-3-phosphoglycerate dehydrogenase / 2-oxoglutarate reductase